MHIFIYINFDIIMHTFKDINGYNIAMFGAYLIWIT